MTEAKPRPSSYRWATVGFVLLVLGYVIGAFGSVVHLNHSEAISAGSSLVGSLFILIGACKLGYDVTQLSRGRSPSQAVRMRLGSVDLRLSTLANLVIGATLIVTYYSLRAAQIGGFGESGDIGGGALVVVGLFLVAVGCVKLAWDVAGRRAGRRAGVARPAGRG